MADALPRDEALAKLEEATAKFQGKFKVPELLAPDVAEVLWQSPASVVLVDTRNRDEQLVSMIPGAITREEFEAGRTGLPPDSRVICYCTVGYRSSQYVEKLRKGGVDAYNMRGSIMSWTHAGLSLVKGDDRRTPTQQVHSYSGTWAWQAPGYTSVSYPIPAARMVLDVATAAMNLSS